jgi:hypothetical protein
MTRKKAENADSVASGNSAMRMDADVLLLTTKPVTGRGRGSVLAKSYLPLPFASASSV